MKKNLFSFFVMCFVTGAASHVVAQNLHKTEEFVSLKPTYLEGITDASDWGSNWFVELKGGPAAFIGSPIGCGDLFDRMKPALQVGFGKWFVPSAGLRISYQGLTFKDANIENQGYHNVHADFLFNLSTLFKANRDGKAKWDIIPFLGAGLIYHEGNKERPFSIHYGVMARYKISNTLRLVGEFGGLSTFSDFDGYGKHNKIGDNMLHLTFGLNVAIGKKGWKKVIDASPYMKQNELLMDYANSMKVENDRLEKMLLENTVLLNEYQKILEIEGLLKKYQKNLSIKVNEKPVYPRNNYSGLNSLRARLAEKQLLADSLKTDSLLVFAGDSVNYIKDLKEGKKFVGSPIYFFFKLRTDIMTDPSQKLNLDELAKVTNKYGLYVSIEGAADSATGTEVINDRLSRQRAEYIKKELMKRGVAEKCIKMVSKGGVEEHDTNEANRHTRVKLYMK